MDDLYKIAKKYAVENAASYGSAQEKNVLGKLLGEFPEYRKDTSKAIKAVKDVIAEVNSLSKEEVEKELAHYGTPEEKEKKRGRITELPNVNGEVVLRFAPNPSGPLHIGHARTAVLNDEYKKKYGGKLILRIEDTDPKRVEKDAYRMIEEDLKWLGVEIDEIITQSRRLAVYRDFALRLIKEGHAYSCSCGQEKFRAFKDAKKNCPCRGNSIEENISRWNKMIEGDTNLVLNLKTDMAHKNPAMRDFPIMRVSTDRHPLTGSDWDVYPLMSFSVAIDDYLSGLTHVLRGKDHIINTQRQLYIYDYFAWKPPEFIHNGLLSIEGVNLSTSAMKKGIDSGEYSSWADPHLGTLRALKRRGIEPEAIRSVMKAIGIGDTDSKFEWQNLYAENRKLIEDRANRYFFVPKPVEVWIKGVPSDADVIKIPLHPNYPQRGFRDIEIKRDSEGMTRLLVAKDDTKNLKKGDVLRLKNFCNIQIDEVRPLMARYLEEKNTKVPILQWLPEDSLGCEVLGPDGKVAGFCEKDCRHLEHGDMIQFVRFGFCRVKSAEDGNVVCYFAHE